MEIAYQPTREDYEEYLCVAWQNAESLAGKSGNVLAWSLAVYVPLAVAAVGFFDFLSQYSGPGTSVLFVALGALGWSFIALLLWTGLGKKRYLRSAVLDDGWFLRPATLKLMPQGLETRAGELGFELPWSGILAMRQTDRLIMLFFDGTAALVIPKRAFSDQTQLADFIGIVQSRILPTGNSGAQTSW